MNTMGDYISIYFLFLMLIGSFFLLNLILAVIMRSFTENDEREKIKAKDAKLMKLNDKKEQLLRKQEDAKLRNEIFKKIFRRSNSAKPASDPDKVFAKLNSGAISDTEESKISSPKSIRKTNLLETNLQTLRHTGNNNMEQK